MLFMTMKSVIIRSVEPLFNQHYYFVSIYFTGIGCWQVALLYCNTFTFIKEEKAYLKIYEKVEHIFKCPDKRFHLLNCTSE